MTAQEFADLRQLQTEVDPVSRTTGVDFLIGNLAAPIC
jgi:hypothetical protein